MLLSAAATLLAATPALAGPGAWYTAPLAQYPSGIESVSARYYIDSASTWMTGYYASTQWSFQGHDVQYFGLQPRTAGAVDGETGARTSGHVVYSVFGEGSTLADPERCHASADGGAGASCALDIDLHPGRWYRIESAVTATTAGRRRWNGTLVDEATGARTYIASFWTDASYGALGASVAQWLEYYLYNGGDVPPPAGRECQEYFRVLYGAPTVHPTGEQAAHSSLFKGSLDDKCAVAAGKNDYTNNWTADGGLVIEAGVLHAH